MDRRAFRVTQAEEHGHPRQDLAFWLSRPAQERVAAVEFLRRQFDGSGARLQRVLRVTHRQPR